jgi:hypothetical protein
VYWLFDRMHFEKFLQFIVLAAYTVVRHNQDILYVICMVIVYLGERFWMVMIRFYFLELCLSFQLLCFTDEELCHCFNVYVAVSYCGDCEDIIFFLSLILSALVSAPFHTTRISGH